MVVEDDPDISEVLRHSLERAGYAVDALSRGDSALEVIRRNPPDLILLDLMLPGMDGLELCRELKRGAGTSGVPLIMLTARSEETDRIVGLELGADDYIGKPFSPREVVLRVKAVLRRKRERDAGDDGDSKLTFGELTIDPSRHELSVGGEPVTLTATEFKLLQFLAERAGRVQRRDTLLSEVWGYSSGIDSRTVDTHVRRLRRKLGPESERIETVIGVGYRFRV